MNTIDTNIDPATGLLVDPVLPAEPAVFRALAFAREVSP